MHLLNLAPYRIPNSPSAGKRKECWFGAQCLPCMRMYMLEPFSSELSLFARLTTFKLTECVLRKIGTSDYLSMDDGGEECMQVACRGKGDMYTSSTDYRFFLTRVWGYLPLFDAEGCLCRVIYSTLMNGSERAWITCARKVVGYVGADRLRQKTWVL